MGTPNFSHLQPATDYGVAVRDEIFTSCTYYGSSPLRTYGTVDARTLTDRIHVAHARHLIIMYKPCPLIYLVNNHVYSII